VKGIHRESPRCAPGTLLIQCRLHKTKKHTRSKDSERAAASARATASGSEPEPDSEPAAAAAARAEPRPRPLLESFTCLGGHEVF